MSDHPQHDGADLANLMAERTSIGKLLSLAARDRYAIETLREKAERRARWSALASWLSFAAAFSLIMYVTALR